MRMKNLEPDKERGKFKGPSFFIVHCRVAAFFAMLPYYDQGMSTIGGRSCFLVTSTHFFL